MNTSITAGEIYLIAEVDPRTGEHTPYCKVGIVRKSADRDSENRRKDHQTGNPRKLLTVATVTTDLVEKVETALHGIYAPWCISGEWFILDPGQREELLGKARELAVQASSAAANLARAAELKDMVSAGDKIVPDEAMRALHAAALVLKDRQKRTNDIIKVVKPTLQSSIQNDGGSNSTGTLQQRRLRGRFDLASFKSAHPDLWCAYVTVSHEPGGRFTLVASAIRDESADLADLERRCDAVRGSDAPGLEEELHSVYLDAVAISAQTKWDLARTENQLKVLCGTAPGIDGVCSWSRTMQVKESFDEKALETDRPDLFGQFVTAGQTRQALVINKDSGFRHN